MARSGRRRPAGVDALALGAALLLIAALAVWSGAAGSDDRAPKDPALTVILADTSVSVTGLRHDARLQIARAVRRAATEAFERGDACAVVTYAASARRRFGPSTDAVALDDFLAGQSARWIAGAAAAAPATDLDAACVLALALLEQGDRPPGRVILLGDGHGTTGGPGLERLAAGTVSAVEIRAPGRPTRFDLAVTGVRASGAVPENAPTTVAVEFGLVGAAPPEDGGALRVRLDWELRASRATGLGIGEPPFLTAGSSPADFPRGAAPPLAWTAALELPSTPPGTVDLTLHARLEAADGTVLGDAFDVDDEGRARWVAGDPDRVLVVGPGAVAPRVARALGGAAFEGFDVRAVAVEDLGAELARGPEPHVLVSVDVPYSALDPEWLARFVVERGGGWLHSAGYARLGSGSAALAGLDALVGDRDPPVARDVHFLIDSSGSMRGARWQRARAAIARLLPALGSGDRLSVRMFSLALGAPQVVFEPREGEGASARRQRFEDASDALRGLEPKGGSTDIAGSLASFLDDGGARGGFRRPPAPGPRERVVVLLTDGHETVGRGNTQELRQKLEREEVRLVVLQVAEGDDARRYLQNFLPPGETVRGVGELIGVYATLQAAVEGLDPVRGARLAPSGEPLGTGRFGDTLDAVRAAVAAGGLVLDQTLPARPTEGALRVLDAAVDGPETGGAAEPSVRTTALAVAERGLGVAAGLALPLVAEDGRLWAPELLRRMDWAAPLLRAMAARCRAARPDAAGRPARAAIEGDRLTVRGLPPELRGQAVLVAEVLRPGGVDALGLVQRPERIAEVELVPPAMGRDAAAVRTAPRPPALDSVPRGARLLLRIAGSGGSKEALELRADGPREVLALFDAARPGPAHVESIAQAERRGRDPAEHGRRLRRPGYTTALALLAALLVFLGGLGLALAHRTHRWTQGGGKPQSKRGPR